MTLYYYPKNEKHRRADTDRRIAESLRRYQTETGSVGSVPAAIFRTANGKPYFEGGFPQLGVTHSDSVVIIALADTPFGIDCEDTERRVPHRDALCERFFSESEKEFVENAGSEVEKTHRFLEIWVKKEAYVKYTGEGLQGMSDTDTFSLSGYFENRSDKKHILYIYHP